MSEANVIVNVNGIVEDELKLAAESFATKVFKEPALFAEYAHIFEAAVEIYKRSIDNKLSTPIQNFN